MKRSSVALLLVTLVMPSLALAAPSGSIAGSLGNLRWGMNDREVKSALRGKIKDKSAASALDSSYVEFDGKPSRWDGTPVGEEYTHGNEEAMLSYKDSDGSENYYFLIGGQLWKWVKLYPAAAFGGSNFGKFSASVEKKFGTGHEKEGEVNPGSGNRYKFVEFLDRNTRLRAVDKTATSGKYALVFEAMDTVRSLASLRANTIRRGSGSKKPAAVAKNDRDDEDSAPSGKPAQRLLQPATQPGAIASANKKKSLFAEQQNGGDTAESYQAKKQRVQQEARDRQRHSYERGEEQKKGKALDGLAGVDDDDPISGM
jgi:hypothetical protein